jgi:hypothetical protein
MVMSILRRNNIIKLLRNNMAASYFGYSLQLFKRSGYYMYRLL